MKHKLYALATVVSLSLIPISTDAATVKLDNQGRVTNIFDLNVDGKFYDVDFQFDTFQNLFGDLDDFKTEPTFWNQKDLGVTARNAINRELNTLNPVPSQVYDDEKDIDFFQFYIPIEVRENSSIPIDSAFGDFFEGEWRIPNIGGSGIDNVGLDWTEMYAIFTDATDPVSTPEPSGGLLGLSITLGLAATFKRQFNKKTM
ncbi:hypothetical protein ACL6C3_15175 [Capilliphycus salinus ALCB114379]|uniref:hypothetical protein n=1 Tax=Capilliphycus salinus TaxID=2768948 RepID=UPI0039A6ED54